MGCQARWQPHSGSGGKNIDVAVRQNYVIQDGVWLTLPGVPMDDGTDCLSVAWIPYIRM